MGKNKKGKKVDIEKKLAQQARKEAKQDKAAIKRLAKERSSAGDQDEETIDQVLQAYKSQNASVKIDKPYLETLSTEFPLPRANTTLEHGADDKTKDYLYLFGGEYFDGIENVVLDELLRYDCKKQEWKQIFSPISPSPRCAHSCVAYKSNLYIFGGELASADTYHHYRDLWKFDASKLEWEEIKARNPPSARSGHTCWVWKHYMIVFGGFFEAARETKWYNDVHVFDFQTEQWMDVPQSRLSIKPEPRSACNAALWGNDKAVIHGGFAKIKTTKEGAGAATETKVHTDAWMLHLAPILQNKPPTWERWISSSKGISNKTPNGRAGMSSIGYKNRLLVFGGVIDHEQHHHKVDSIFYNDFMAMDMDRRKWFPLKVKDNKKSGKGRRRRGGNDDNDEAEKAQTEDEQAAEDDSGSDLEEEEDDEMDTDEKEGITGWNLDMLRKDMFAFIDGDGNMVYEKIDTDEKKEEDVIEESKVEEEEKEEEEDEEKEEEKEEATAKESVNAQAEAAKPATPQDASNNAHPTKITSSSVMVLNESTNAPEAVARADPLPRLNASMLVHGNTCYLLGGILEVGDREITLDDMWALDLRKRDKWECLWPGTMHKQVWRGAIHDDDDSYISTGTGREDDDDEEDDFEEEGDGIGDELQSSKKSSKRSGLKQEVKELNEKYGLDNDNRTPRPGEALAEFYSRTSEYWNSLAAKDVDEELSNKEMKRMGFASAKERYEDLEPVLQRLTELGLGGRSDSTDKEKKKDKKKKSSKR